VYPEGSVAADVLLPLAARILLALPSTFLLITFFLYYFIFTFEWLS
jgi:hypothetical protein